MKEFKIKLYSFDELSESAKRVVCDKEREDIYGNFGTMQQERDAEDRIYTLNKFCEVFNITYRIDYDHQYRFISWQFQYVDMNDDEWCDEDIKGKYLLRFINKHFKEITSPKCFFTHGYYDENRQYYYKYRHSSFQREKKNCPFTGMCYDEDIMDKIWEWYENPNWNITLHDLFDDVFHYYMRLWEKEDDYRVSDEFIGEMITVNWGDKLYYENGVEFEGDLDELETLQSLSDEE